MIVILPTSLLAQDPNRGLLHNDGGTWLNDVPAPAVAAIFPDSLVQTQKGHFARIDVEGSSVLIQPETMVQFQGHELVLDHGTLQVDTSRGVEVIVGCITVTPVNSDRTEYDVTDGGGKVRVAAAKNDVKIHLHGSMVRESKQGSSSDSIVHEGQHSTRSEHCGGVIRPLQGQGATVPLLDTSAAKIAGGMIVGVVACLGLCHTDDPISPSKP
jgi:hypothetical protein